MESYKSAKIWEPIDFTVYFKFVRWYVLLLLILEIGLRIFVGNYPNSIFFEQIELVAWAVRILVFGFMGFKVVKHFGHSAAVAAMAGFLAGFSSGLVVSLYRFFDGITVWKFFNIITETILVGAVGALVCVLMIFVLSFKK
jgi:hypothetical protein